MPISKHYKGHGDEVMSSMKKTYGSEKAKRVFYATENAQKSGKKKSKKHGRK
jgi:hypothetical protein